MYSLKSGKSEEPTMGLKQLELRLKKEAEKLSEKKKVNPKSIFVNLKHYKKKK